MNIKIRKMQLADIKQVTDLEKEVFQHPWTEEDFKKAITEHGAIYIIAEDQGEILGMCGVRNLLGDGEITNVAVKVSYRQKQVATKLMDFLMEEGYQSGIQAYTLEVRKSNTAAMRLYEKLGFETEGIRPGFYETPKEDACIMWKR